MAKVAVQKFSIRGKKKRKCESKVEDADHSHRSFRGPCKQLAAWCKVAPKLQVGCSTVFPSSNHNLHKALTFNGALCEHRSQSMKLLTLKNGYKPVASDTNDSDIENLQCQGYFPSLHN